MFRRSISLDNYLTIRSMEHAFDVKYTTEEVEKLVNVLKEQNVKNTKDGGDSTQTRSKI